MGALSVLLTPVHSAFRRALFGVRSRSDECYEVSHTELFTGADSRQPFCLRSRLEIRFSLVSPVLSLGRLRLGSALSV